MLTLAGAALATPARSEPPLHVLFVGNSFTFEHDLPGLFADIARQGGHDVQVDMVAQGGAHLSETLEATAPEALIAQYRPDLVVLQDFSTVALVPAFSDRSLEALRSFCRHVTVRKILFATWPRAEGHKLYRQPDMPATPAEMNARVDAHYTTARCPSMVENAAMRVAPVGRAWVLGAGLALHREDGYHANPTGVWLSALVIARTAGLAPDHPRAPTGVRAAKRLIQIAKTVAP